MLNKFKQVLLSDTARVVSVVESEPESVPFLRVFIRKILETLVVLFDLDVSLRIIEVASKKLGDGCTDIRSIMALEVVTELFSGHAVVHVIVVCNLKEVLLQVFTVDVELYFFRSEVLICRHCLETILYSLVETRVTAAVIDAVL